jgi:UDP-2,3-diacylglucosamine hydrolase
VTVLFVSDLHLDAARPRATQAFLDFLAGDARKARTLYILGDLFEYWVGDDDPNPHHQQVVTALAELTVSGTRCFALHGNRDFMLGKRFAAASGVVLLHDPTLIYVGGSSVLISHGDMLCTDDISYQRFRTIVRTPWVQFIYRSLPLSIRHRIAAQMRSGSSAAYEAKASEIFDVNQTAVEACLREYQVQILLHGHTHRPAIHEFTLDHRDCLRIVLGDWYTQGSVLRWDDGGPQLTAFDF